MIILLYFAGGGGRRREEDERLGRNDGVLLEPGGRGGRGGQRAGTGTRARAHGRQRVRGVVQRGQQQLLRLRVAHGARESGTAGESAEGAGRAGQDLKRARARAEQRDAF